jgi:protein phosphatase
VSCPWALATDTGLVRDNNEDAANAWPDMHLFAIADGMGGHVAGEVASHVALQTVFDVVDSARRPRNIAEERSLLSSAVSAANDAVVREGEVRGLEGMGTTLTLIRIRNRTVVAAHVGDTRLYVVERDKLDQITKDHTMVAMLVNAGAVHPKDAHVHPDRHLLTRAIGSEADVRVDAVHARIPRGSRLLLSTDGMHDLVPEDEILDLATRPSLDAAARALVEAANRHGGPDNSTVLLLEP